MIKTHIRLYLCLILLPFHLCAYEYTLGLCAIFQDEGPYLREWIQFHQSMGVQHFWLYDNHSTDAYEESIQDFIEKGVVEIIEWHYPSDNIYEWNHIQCSAYNDALSKVRGVTEWLVIIDADEFLFPMQHSNLIDFLEEYKDVAAVCANWQVFGTSGIAKLSPDESLLQNLVMKAPQDSEINLHVKSIVRPETVLRMNNPHFPILEDGFYQVNADKMPFYGPFSPDVRIDKIRINHYWTRDEAFLMSTKLARWLKWPRSVEELVERAEEFNQVYDAEIHRFCD